MNDQQVTNRNRFGRWSPARPTPRMFQILVVTALFFSACGGADEGTEQADSDDSGRSSGSSQTDDVSSESTTDGANTPAAEDESSDATPDNSTDADPDSTVLGPETSIVEPTIRPDGLELAFVDGALGGAKLGDTIDQITEALGTAYVVTPEDSIRVDFESGYSISREGEVLFFAIEEDGLITVFMTQHPRVGLDSGLRPSMDLADGIGLHGEPTFTFGPEGREFASFADGTGSDGSLSILVAIGQFGGPVGVYENLEVLAETTEYQPEDANIKELWFWNQ